MTMTAEAIAHVCHEANRAVQIEQADPTIPVSPLWEDLDQETRESAIDGVQNVLAGASPRESHENWMQFKLDRGWKLGPVKDEEKKEHPLLVPYDELPDEQRMKDALFIAIVAVCSRGIGAEIVSEDKTNESFREGFGEGR